MTQILRLPSDEAGKRAMLWLYRGSGYLDAEAEAMRAATLAALDEIDEEHERRWYLARGAALGGWQDYLAARCGEGDGG